MNGVEDVFTCSGDFDPKRLVDEERKKYLLEEKKEQCSVSSRAMAHDSRSCSHEWDSVKPEYHGPHFLEVA